MDKMSDENNVLFVRGNVSVKECIHEIRDLVSLSKLKLPFLVSFPFVLCVCFYVFSLNIFYNTYSILNVKFYIKGSIKGNNVINS